MKPDTKTRREEYRIWVNMKARCNNSASTQYQCYGGRGISVCEKWHRFESFLHDMGKRPFKHAELDRIDNDGNYEPSNCRWTTKEINCQNRRSTRLSAEMVTAIRHDYFIGCKSTTELASKYNVSEATVYFAAVGKTWKNVPFPVDNKRLINAEAKIRAREEAKQEAQKIRIAKAIKRAEDGLPVDQRGKRTTRPARRHRKPTQKEG